MANTDGSREEEIAGLTQRRDELLKKIEKQKEEIARLTKRKDEALKNMEEQKKEFEMLKGKLPECWQTLPIAEAQIAEKLKCRQFKTLPGYWSAPFHTQVKDVLEEGGLTPQDLENMQVISDVLERHKIPRRGKVMTRVQVQEDKIWFEAFCQDYPKYAEAYGLEVATMKKFMDFLELYPEVEGSKPEE